MTNLIYICIDVIPSFYCSILGMHPLNILLATNILTLNSFIIHSNHSFISGRRHRTEIGRISADQRCLYRCISELRATTTSCRGLGRPSKASGLRPRNDIQSTLSGLLPPLFRYQCCQCRCRQGAGDGSVRGGHLREWHADQRHDSPTS